MEQLIRVEAPHFVAAFIMRGEQVVRAAPILKWVHGKTRDEMRAYFKRKGWKASIVPPK